MLKDFYSHNRRNDCPSATVDLAWSKNFVIAQLEEEVGSFCGIINAILSDNLVMRGVSAELFLDFKSIINEQQKIIRKYLMCKIQTEYSNYVSNTIHVEECSVSLLCNW
jgi:hypothetical protein